MRLAFPGDFLREFLVDQSTVFVFQLTPFQTIPITEPLLDLLIEKHETISVPRFQRLWNYYRNALAEPDDLGPEAIFQLRSYWRARRAPPAQG